jgi:divalent metal cation (Fe/Co/Zn/Cd) transporter
LACILIIGIRGFLIGKRAKPEIEEKIKSAALEIPEVNDVEDLRTMYLGGDQLLVNMEVNMKDKLTTNELEILMDKIKEHVKKKVPSIQHIQVELETQ